MKEILTVVAALLVLAARAGIPLVLLFAMGYASERLRRSQEDGGHENHLRSSLWAFDASKKQGGFPRQR
jgi:hypothetical protein